MNQKIESNDNNRLMVGEVSVKNGNTIPCPGCGYEISHGIDGIDDPNPPATKDVICPNCDLKITMDDGYYLCNGCKGRISISDWQDHIKNCSGIKMRLFVCPECENDILLDDDELEQYISLRKVNIVCPDDDCGKQIELDETYRKINR